MNYVISDTLPPLPNRPVKIGHFWGRTPMPALHLIFVGVTVATIQDDPSTQVDLDLSSTSNTRVGILIKK